MAHFELVEQTAPNAVIKVIGVGGGGGNAVAHMVNSGVEGVEFIMANTDAQAIKQCGAKTHLQLGANVTKGLGAGANPEVGRQAALEDREGQVAMQQLDERRAARQFNQLDNFDSQAQALKRGMWFDVSIEQGTHIRCRLSWVSPMRTRLLFTNRDGFDAFVRSEREVSAMLRMGRMRVLDSEAIVGRALDKIMVGSGDLQVAA